MDIIVNREVLINAIELPLKASKTINVSTFGTEGIILFKTMPPDTIAIFGYSSSVEVLSTFVTESQFDIEIVKLFNVENLLRFLKSSKKKTISIELREKTIKIQAEGNLLLPEYKDITSIFPHEEVEILLNANGLPIPINFTDAVNIASKFPYSHEIQAELSGIGIYNGHVFGMQRERGIVLKLENGEEWTLTNIIPPTITTTFPKNVNELLGNMDKTAIIIGKSIDNNVVTTLKFSMLIYNFPQHYGDVLLKYISKEKGNIIFNKNELKDILKRLQTSVNQDAPWVKFEFKETGFVNLSTFTTSSAYTEKISIIVNNLKPQNFKVKYPLLKDITEFDKGNENVILYFDTPFRFDLPILTTNKTNDWLYTSFAKGDK